ncbi:hypothetical protein SAMN05660337_2010 [Maridesulfovibrio ferrireducens]|uniref:Pimeloyl-[acyl-carrier protein] methyl ester esterase n=1 Tax=Maridesulfovibrio ferrireducens TaxID=246191 RepID=A0A1G9H4T8_9BACT|nr:alpha/beta hydrolase [Maridesulfovibrio ferrireducens]SDL08028.1 hypothetical protein SAMN05660337_2010 [Maridesulfovibrio ferrireducens]
MGSVFIGGWATAKEQYPVFAESGDFLIPFIDFSPAELSDYLTGGKILVGWSTGAHVLLKECRHLFSRYDQVVLIAPFLSFTDSFPERTLRRMISGLRKNPDIVVSSFHKNCGEDIEIPFNARQVDALVEGLEYLIASRISFEEDLSLVNLTLVHGDNDKIVRESAFESVVKLVPRAKVLRLESGHKISENEIINLIKGL